MLIAVSSTLINLYLKVAILQLSSHGGKGLELLRQGTILVSKALETMVIVVVIVEGTVVGQVVVMTMLIVGLLGAHHTEVVGIHHCGTHPLVEDLGGTDQGPSPILLMAVQTGSTLGGLGDASKVCSVLCCRDFTSLRLGSVIYRFGKRSL